MLRRPERTYENDLDAVSMNSKLSVQPPSRYKLNLCDAQRVSRETVFHVISGSTISTQDLQKQRVTADSVDLVAGCRFSLTIDLQIQSYLPYRHLFRKLPQGDVPIGMTPINSRPGRPALNCRTHWTVRIKQGM